MRPNSPSAVIVSLILHGFVVALIFVTTMFVARQERVAPVIFELVAGPPTAPNELVAPAKGNTTAQVTPKPPVPEMKTTPEPEVVEKAPVKPDPSIAKELKQSEKVSYQEYLKKHPTPKTPPATTPRPPARVQHIDATGIANGATGGSTANTKGGGGGKALTRAEADEMQVYESLLRNRLEEAFQSTKPTGLSDALSAEVEFFVAASGEISNIRISRSAGNRDFDQSVLEAFRRITWPGARPDRKSDVWRLTFRMKDE